MKFLYIDVKDGKLVGVFKNIAGNVNYFTKEEILEHIEKAKVLNRRTMLNECKEALHAIQTHKKPKKWWKFW